jgi:GNAT superfamily N-acetyltransferase
MAALQARPAATLAPVPGSSNLQVRRYSDGDRAAVLSLHERALEDAGAHAGHGPWDDDLESIAAVYLDTGGEFLVGELDGTLVAMGALRPVGPGRAEVKRMRVEPAHQRRGFGELILRSLEDCALRLGVRELQLDTTTVQTAAERLYRKHGYIETARSHRGAQELIIFKKQLSA